MNIGKRLYGFCNGFFGCYSYEDKIIVFETERAIACIRIKDDVEDWLTVANFDTKEEKQKYIDEWSKKQVINISRGDYYE